MQALNFVPWHVSPIEEHRDLLILAIERVKIFLMETSDPKWVQKLARQQAWLAIIEEKINARAH